MPSALIDNNTLPHEMTHALLDSNLPPFLLRNLELMPDLNLGIDEGLATQNGDLGCYGDKKDLPAQNKCFGRFSPKNYKDKLTFYSLHQHMIHDWIKEKGIAVVASWLKEVKKGKDSVQAFLDLGGDKIAKEYNCTMENKSLTLHDIIIKFRNIMVLITAVSLLKI